MSLTLEQVKKAGRFAWCQNWRLYVPGYGVLEANIVRDDLLNRLEIASPEDDYIPFSSRELAVWHHLPGCDCEYCALPSSS